MNRENKSKKNQFICVYPDTKKGDSYRKRKRRLKLHNTSIVTKCSLILMLKQKKKVNYK